MKAALLVALMLVTGSIAQAGLDPSCAGIRITKARLTDEQANRLAECFTGSSILDLERALLRHNNSQREKLRQNNVTNSCDDNSMRVIAISKASAEMAIAGGSSDAPVTIEQVQNIRTSGNKKTVLYRLVRSTNQRMTPGTIVRRAHVEMACDGARITSATVVKSDMTVIAERSFGR